MRWKLEEALELIRHIQPRILSFNYHVTLGGGVLNKGYSDKDLDLYFIPFSGKNPRSVEMRDYLSSLWGQEYNLGGPEVRASEVHLVYPDEPTWVNGRFTYRYNNRRIDVFIA